MKLNREELLYGAAFGVSMFWWTQWLAVPTAGACALLWALAGAGAPKFFRRFWCPMIQAMVLTWSIRSMIPFISVIPAFGILSLGYGIPDVNDPHGSALGGFFWKLFNKNELWANLLTRGTIMVCLWLSFAIPILVKR